MSNYKKSIKYIAIFAIIILILAGCSAEKTESLISNNIKTKVQAIETQDSNLYMTTVTKNDYYYRNEQIRWFTEMAFKGIKNISMKVDEAKQLDDETIVATIHQEHSNNEKFDFTYPLLFRLENGKWVDYGYDFKVRDAGRFSIKFMEGETRVDAFIQMTDQAYDNLEPIFPERPDSSFEIKLFNDQELLRQRTIPSNAWLFTGWGEPNESLKLYTGHPDIDRYRGTVQHEVVHHITINICKNNLPIWLYEGIAMYYGSAYFGHDSSAILSTLKKENVKVTIEYLENTDMSVVTDKDEIYDWYNRNYMYTVYMIETYGHDKFMDLFYEAGKKPFNDSAANAFFITQNNVTMDEVLMTVLGITKQQLSDDYLVWLEKTDFIN